MKLALRLLPCAFPFLLASLGACSDSADDEDVDSAEGAKKVKPGSVDPDMRAYFKVVLPNAGGPIASAKYYLDDDALTVGTPFLVDLTSASTVVKNFRICYDTSKKFCASTSVQLFRKQTNTFTVALLGITLNPPKVATVPAPPAADFGPAGARFIPMTNAPLTVRQPSVTITSTDALLASVKDALDGSGTKYLPAITTSGWGAESPEAGAAWSTVTNGFISTVALNSPDARAEAPRLVTVHTATRENPNAFPQTCEIVLGGPQGGPPSTDNVAWGPTHTSTTGILLPTFSGSLVPIRAKTLSTTTDTSLKIFLQKLPSSSEYGVLLNRKQYVPVSGTTDVHIDRVDVDDPVVTNEATGGTYTVNGKWQLLTQDYKPIYDTEFDTGTGVDVIVGSNTVIGSPDKGASNVYYVVTRFTTASGPQATTERVQF